MSEAAGRTGDAPGATAGPAPQQPVQQQPAPQKPAPPGVVARVRPGVRWERRAARAPADPPERITGPAEAPERRRTLRARLRLAFTYAAVLLVLGVGTTVVSVVRLESATRNIVDRLSPARIAAAQLATAYVDQESGIRGYLLTREEAFLTPYDNAQRVEADSARMLRADLARYPRVLGALEALDSAGRQWRAEFAEPAKAAARAATAAPVRFGEDSGKARFDAVRQAATELDNSLNAERETARHRLRNALLRLEVLFALAMLAICAVGALIWQNLRRDVLTPLDALGGEARAVADGDFRRHVAAEGPAEIEALARDVEEMRRRIVAAYEESETARDELRTQADLLELQADDLRRSNDELEQFAYVASHDLQEPLRKVASFCQMLERRYSGQLDERADQYIAFAVDGAKRMQLLINDLLAFSRVGRTSAGMTQVDCAEVARRALDSLATAQLEAEAEVLLRDLPVVHGDATLLTQLFQNLIGNAMKFRAPDRPCHVELSAELDDGEWHFRCVDNGIGVEPQYADRIFVIFQRLHSKDTYDGTGIGLSLCKKIVEYHGGRIWLDTDRVDGCTVHWTLPVPSADGPGEPAPEAEPAVTESAN